MSQFAGARRLGNTARTYGTTTRDCLLARSATRSRRVSRRSRARCGWVRLWSSAPLPTERYRMLAETAMEEMIDAVISFAQDDTKREPALLVDVVAMVDDICDDAADADHLGEQWRDPPRQSPRGRLARARGPALRRAADSRVTARCMKTCTWLARIESTRGEYCLRLVVIPSRRPSSSQFWSPHRCLQDHPHARTGCAIKHFNICVEMPSPHQPPAVRQLAEPRLRWFGSALSVRERHGI